jgi:hypothetical protein
MSAVGAISVTSLGAKGGTIIPGLPSYTINYVIVAGGGGGALDISGGGGAGGVLKGSATVLTPNTTYTIVVGGGGGGGSGPGPTPTGSAANGSNSYISTTGNQAGSIPSIGIAYGGGAGRANAPGYPGGSGGGGVGATNSLGVPGQGYPSITRNCVGSGGGGAGGPGTNCSCGYHPIAFVAGGPGTPLATPALPYPILGPIPSYPPSTPAKSTGGLVGGGGGVGGGPLYPPFPCVAHASLGGPGGGGPGAFIGPVPLFGPIVACYPGTVNGAPGKVNTGGGAGSAGLSGPARGTGGTGGPGTIIISAPTPRIGTAGPPASFITGTDGAGNTWIQFLSSGTYTA